MIKFYTKNFNVSKIYAFEPNKKIFDKLKKKTKNISGTELFLFNFAIGNINKNKTVIEIGAGYGNLTKAIASEGPKKIFDWALAVWG